MDFSDNYPEPQNNIWDRFITRFSPRARLVLLLSFLSTALITFGYYFFINKFSADTSGAAFTNDASTFAITNMTIGSGIMRLTPVVAGTSDITVTASLHTDSSSVWTTYGSSNFETAVNDDITTTGVSTTTSGKIIWFKYDAPSGFTASSASVTVKAGAGDFVAYMSKTAGMDASTVQMTRVNGGCVDPSGGSASGNYSGFGSSFYVGIKRGASLGCSTTPAQINKITTVMHPSQSQSTTYAAGSIINKTPFDSGIVGAVYSKVDLNGTFALKTGSDPQIKLCAGDYQNILSSCQTDSTLTQSTGKLTADFTSVKGRYYTIMVSLGTSGSETSILPVNYLVTYSAPVTPQLVVNITSPANNTNIASGTVTMNAEAHFTGGTDTVSKVQFRIDGNNVGYPDTASPYEYTTPVGLTLGSHTLTAIAYSTQNLNLSVESASVSITYGSTTPQIDSITPTSGPFGNMITLAGKNLGSTGSAKFSNGNSETAASIVSWTSSEVKILSAVNTVGISYDVVLVINGNSYTAPQKFTVTASNQPPVIEIISPADNATLAINTDYEMKAKAADPDGTQSVTFKVDDVSKTPTAQDGDQYSFSSLNFSTIGRHTLEVLIQDKLGDTHDLRWYVNLVKTLPPSIISVNPSCNSDPTITETMITITGTSLGEQASKSVRIFNGDQKYDARIVSWSGTEIKAELPQASLVLLRDSNIQFRVQIYTPAKGTDPEKPWLNLNTSLPADKDFAKWICGNKVWIGMGVDNNWATAANWSDNKVPISSDKVYFVGSKVTGNGGQMNNGSKPCANATGEVSEMTIEASHPVPTANGGNGTVAFSGIFKVGILTQRGGLLNASNAGFHVSDFYVMTPAVFSAPNQNCTGSINSACLYLEPKDGGNAKYQVTGTFINNKGETIIVGNAIAHTRNFNITTDGNTNTFYVLTLFKDKNIGTPGKISLSSNAIPTVYLRTKNYDTPVDPNNQAMVNNTSLTINKINITTRNVDLLPSSGKVTFGGDSNSNLFVRGNFNNNKESKVDFLSNIEFISTTPVYESVVTGSTKFQSNFTVQTDNKVMKFEPNSLQTIIGDFTVKGTDGKLIKLLSSAASDSCPAAQWQIAPVGNYSIDYAEIADSKNLAWKDYSGNGIIENGEDTISATNGKDGCNNTNWNIQSGSGSVAGASTKHEDFASTVYIAMKNRLSSLLAVFGL